jgi:hypothetical protein
VKAGNNELDNFWDLTTGEFRVGNTRNYEDSSHNGNDNQLAEYLHYVPGSGFFQKIKNFIVSSVLSILWGRFKIFRAGQDKASLPVMDVNPGADPAGEAKNHAASVFRGAFTVKKSNNTLYPGYDDSVFEALPSGSVNIPKALNTGGLLRTFKTVDLSALDQNTYYPVTAAITRSKGFFEVVVDVQLDSGTKPSWSTHASGFSCFQHILTLPSGWGAINPLTICLGRTALFTSDSSIPVGWSQMDNSSTAVLWLRGGGKYKVWDSANTAWTVRTAAYTVYEQTVQPQTSQVFTFTYSTVYANLSAQSAAMGTAKVTGTTASTSPATGALTVAGGAGISGALNVGGASSFTRLNGDILEFYQGGIMKASIKLAALGLLMSGLLTACDGILNQGDSKNEIIDTSMPWTIGSSSALGTDSIAAMAYGGGRFVAGGNNGKMAYSSNGTTWTPVSDSKFGATYITTMAYGAGKFVAGGYNGKMAYSSDGVTWTPVSDSTFETTIGYAIASVIYADNKFVAADNHGNIAHSTDGITWTRVGNTTFGVAGMAYGSGKFVAAGGQKAAYSANGVSWTQINSSALVATNVTAITYGGDRFVAVGDSGNKAAYSSDGVTWTPVSDSAFPSGNSVFAITYAGGKFVAGGYNGIITYSADGVTWSKVANLLFGSANSINSMVCGNGKLIAGSSDGRIAYWTTITAKLVFNADGSVGWVKA